MQVKEDFIEPLLDKADNWVIVLVFLMYFGFKMYMKYADGVALGKTLDMLKTTITDLVQDTNGLLRGIDRSIAELSARIGDFLNSRS